MAILLYFDTNVLRRPFEDQTIRRIRRETEALERILEKTQSKEAAFITSDILVFEIQRIVSPGSVGLSERIVRLLLEMIDSPFARDIGLLGAGP